MILTSSDEYVDKNISVNGIHQSDPKDEYCIIGGRDLGWEIRIQKKKISTCSYVLSKLCRRID